MSKKSNIKVKKRNINKRTISFNNFLGKVCQLKFGIKIIKLITLINLFKPTISDIRTFFINFLLSKITLKIKGRGNSLILGSSFLNSYYPSEVYLNSEQKAVNNSYNFINDTNIVELIWNNNIEKCEYMFDGCKNITEIDLSNFDTSQVSKMRNMFASCSSLISLNLSNISQSCSSLTSLNLSNFDVSELTTVSMMFKDCNTLSYLNIKKFSKATFYSTGQKDVFEGVPDNIVVCLDSNYNQNSLSSKIYEETDCPIIYCLDDWQSKRKKIIIDNDDKCLDNCDEPPYIYEYNGKCYRTPHNINIEEYQTSSFKTMLSTNDIQTDYNAKEISSSIIINIINTEKLNSININYQEPTDALSTKEILNEETININFQETTEVLNNQEDYIEEEKDEIKLYNKFLENIETIFTSENYNTSKLDNGEDDYIEFNKILITLTTTENQKINVNNNLTTIYLSECENSIRSHYNLINNETIYMKKIDVIQEGMKIPKIEYDIYCKLNSSKLIKLNITTICVKDKILLSIPIKITENIDILNTTSNYYKDICYQSTSGKGTDMILKDRKKEFIKENKTVCQEDCSFFQYNYDIQKANCSCNIVKSDLNYTNININTTKLYENFEDNNINKKDISNLGITSCNIFDSNENLKNNTGFYLLLFILVIFIIVFIIFYIRGLNLLKQKINEVIQKKFGNKNSPQKNKVKKNNNILENRIISNKKTKSKRKRNKKKDSLIKSNTTDNKLLNKKKNKKNNILPANSLQNKNNKKLDAKTINNNNKPDTDYEFNWLSYEKALIYDKRSSCDYYCSLIGSKQLFIFTFCSFNDYNSGIIKKFTFFLSFALHYTINALFFDDSNIHQIYEDEGKYNFGYQIPYIIISAIASTLFLRLILKFFILTDKIVVEVKQQQNIILAKNKKKSSLKCIKIKFAFFFVFNFILLGFFWYYLTCFNAVYKNTQIYLIENTCISFGLSLFYPFIINLLPMSLRMCSINSKNKNHRCLYNVSKFLQVL